MHAGRHQTASERGERVVYAANFLLERVGQRIERWRWLGVLELDQVEHELVGPTERVAIDVRGVATRHRAQ